MAWRTRGFALAVRRIDDQELSVLAESKLAEIKPARGQSWAETTVRRVLKNPQGVIALIGLTVLVVVAVLAPFIATEPNAQAASGRLLPPSREHIFGVDEFRRDLFSRVVYGLRISLVMAIGAVSIGAVIGSALGFMAGYMGRWVDAVAMRFVDTMLAFPGLLIALAIITVLGASIVNVGIAIVIFVTPQFMRLSRGQMLAEKHREYVIAARSLGASTPRIVFRHAALNAFPPLLTNATLAMASAVLLEASLSFLGLGQQPPDPSLGNLINGARSWMREAWWYMLIPAGTLTFLLLCLTLLSDAVNEATSPWVRRRS